MMSPPLALTMGEPAGIGPDLILQAWNYAHNGDQIPPFIAIADPRVLKLRAEYLQLNIPFEILSEEKIPNATNIFRRSLPIFPVHIEDPTVFKIPSPKNAAAVQQAIALGIDLCTRNVTSALVTCPIHKAVLAAAGFPHPGHTEYLGELAGPNYTPIMMLACPDLRVVPLTVHCAITEVPSRISKDLILDVANSVLKALSHDFGITHPRLAIAALNPHAGEDGLMGHEENTIIRPAIAALMQQGHTVHGPHPADTLFWEDARGTYDAALCMYHDQALIPIKTLDFHGGTNITLGLPFVRTSPDHGTAFNLVGTGKARPDSLFAALNTAQSMWTTRMKVHTS